LKVLLLHPADTIPWPTPSERWDLIIDFARAPDGTYENWRRQAGCPVLSLYQFAEEVDDLRVTRELLQLGTGYLADHWGIDWWDVLSLEIVAELRQLMLVHRLSKELDKNCELYATRLHPLAAALRRLLGARLTILESNFRAVIHRMRHYHEVFSHLDTAEFAQVLADKFDSDHAIRRRVARRTRPTGIPVILLPSAYINVSRVALSYAEQLPVHHFLLVHARNNAKVPVLPPNVRSASLSPYFVPSDKLETASLLESWNGLRNRLARGTEVFSTADAMGLLRRFPALLRWGLALRDAWSQVFESENVTACFCADDSNPPSSIPLIMARKRGLPVLACHHGALDYQMAIKTNHADVYLAKSEMERDYLRRICRLAPEKIVVAPPMSSKPPRVLRHSARWLVFFTEPYASSGWRSDEVYRDLLPRLCTLAQTCGLKLVFKLHPFESIKRHRKMLRRLVPQYERQIEVVAGPPSDQLWGDTRFALTVQSSTAVECRALGIPVFLCAWLRDSWAGYLQQYARFSVGHVLESPDQLSEIPELLANQNNKSIRQGAAQEAIELEDLQDLFSGNYSLAVASNG
jgi:hypothetical protein